MQRAYALQKASNTLTFRSSTLVAWRIGWPSCFSVLGFRPEVLTGESLSWKRDEHCRLDCKMHLYQDFSSILGACANVGMTHMGPAVFWTQSNQSSFWKFAAYNLKWQEAAPLLKADCVKFLLDTTIQTSEQYIIGDSDKYWNSSFLRRHCNIKTRTMHHLPPYAHISEASTSFKEHYGLFLALTIIWKGLSGAGRLCAGFPPQAGRGR